MIIIKTRSEIETMRQGGRLLARIFKDLSPLIVPGLSTEELNRKAEKIIRENKAEPSFKNYRDYPKAICVSLNDEVVHGIPHEHKVIKSGDLVGLDIGLKYMGFYTDMAATFAVGRVSKKAKRLLNVTKKCLELGLRQVRPGRRIGDISSAIQNYAESNGFSVVRDLVGHGVGREIHEEPKIPNFGQPGIGPELSLGMTLAIEPMLTAGSSEVMTDEDNWTVRTADGSLAAHFEVTVAVTMGGGEVLTK